MPEKPVPAIESAGVNSQQPLHAFHQIGLGRFHDQMKVIGHQTQRMDLPPGAPTALAQGFDEPLPVLLILEDDLAPIPAAHQVIDRPLILHSHLARHGRIVTGPVILSIVRTDNTF